MKNHIQEFIDNLGPEYEGYANSIKELNSELEKIKDENKKLKEEVQGLKECYKKINMLNELGRDYGWTKE